MSLSSSLESAVQLFKLRHYHLGQDLPVSPGGGPVLLLGSSPTATVPSGFNSDWRLVCVNASQASAERLGLPEPDITVLRTGLFDNKQVDREAAEALRGRRCRLLAFRGEEVDRQRIANLLAKLDYLHEELIMLGRVKRERIVLSGTKSLSGLVAVNKDLSNGMFSLFCCLDLFSGPVVLSGFSFSVGGHAYNASNLPRHHVSQDKLALQIIKARGWPVYSANAEFSAESGLPKWTGDVV